MKRLTPYLLGAVIGMLMLGAFVIGQAAAAPLAATGCFSDSNGHWAEPYICWASQKGIIGGFPDGTYRPENTVSRAQVAVMLQKQAEVPPTTGDIIINLGPSAWEPNGVAPNYITYYTNLARLRSSAVGNYGFQASAPAPSQLYGRATRLKGVRLCYSANANATLNYVALQLWDNASSPSTLEGLVEDTTVRTDTTCRTYTFASPVLLFPTDHVVLYVQSVINNTSNHLDVSSAAFIFTPTDLTISPLEPLPLRPEIPGLLETQPGESGAQE